jgi:hypothetical protein
MATTTAPATPDTPPQPPATPPGWEVLTVRAAEILALEQAAKTAFTPFRKRLQRLMRTAMAAWVRTTGGLHVPADPLQMAAVTAVVLGELDDLDVGDVQDKVGQVVQRAVDTGWRHTLDEVRALDAFPGVELSDEVDDLTRHVDLGWLPVDPVVRREIQRIEQVMRAHIADAARQAYRLGETGRWTEVADVVARATQAATGGERIAAWAVNAAANQGARDTAVKLGFERVWVAERNACVVCLALSGTVSVDQEFDATATYGHHAPGVYPPGALLQPPRHPWCRCRAEIWRGSVPGYTGPDLPAALRREAERSVLSGWALPSERVSIRLYAARKALARGSRLPVSVQQRARRALVHGRFDPPPRAATTPSSTASK